jgi:hypothetical protein
VAAELKGFVMNKTFVAMVSLLSLSLLSCTAKWSQVGRLVDVQGRPIVGAEVFVATPDRQLSIMNGESTLSDTVSMLTVEDGRFWIPNEGVPYSVFVLDERGYAEASGESLSRSPDLVLEPWAAVEGRVRLQGTPVWDDTIVLQIDRQIGLATLLYRRSTQSTARGVFVIDRVPPGEATVGRQVSFQRGYTDMIILDHGKTIRVKPNQISKATLGGRGGLVRGRLVVPDKPDFDFNSYFLFSYLHHTQTDDQPEITVAIDVQADGSFQARDVPPGEYELLLKIYELNDSPPWDTGRLLMNVYKTVSIPKHSPLGGYDLGTIVCHIQINNDLASP